MWNARTFDGPLIPQEETFVATRRVIQVDPETDSRYEAYVESQPNALIYHHPASENRGRPLCLACEDADGRLSGALPMFQTREFEGGALEIDARAKVLKFVCRRLPLSATMRLGDWIYRYL